MPNYQNSKIYTIRSNKTEKIYIGSTCQLLCRRLSKHKTCNNHGIFLSSKEILDNGDGYIELLENYPCNNKEELLKREGELIRQNKNICVNMIVPKRTVKEWVIENKNKVIISQKKRLIKINCLLCSKLVSKANMNRHEKNCFINNT